MSRHAFLVLGMHRSGTSATTRLFNLAGAAISERLMPPLADNPKGFWESLSIAELHDQALASLGMTWDSIERIPDEWFDSPDGELLRAGLRAHVEANFAEGESFVIKDPRACRFVPAWLSVVEETGYRPVAVLPLRNPLEVARSLERRNGFPLSQSLLLWLRHVLDAESTTRSISRAVIDYSRLIDDWRSELAGVNRQLGFTCFASSLFYDEQVERFLSRTDRHHAASRDELAAEDRFGWTTEAFAALDELRDPAAVAAATRKLDAIRAAFDDAESVWAPFLASYRTQVQVARSNQAAAEARAAAVHAAAARAEGQLEGQRVTIAQLTSSSAELNCRIERLQEVVAASRVEIDAERSARTTLERQLSETVGRTLTVQASLETSRAALASAQDDARREHAHRQALEQECTTVRRRNAALDRELERYRRRDDEATRASVRAAADDRNRRSAALGAGHGRLTRLRRLLSDAQVEPSRWLTNPLRSAINLARLGRQDYRRRVGMLAASGLFDREFYARDTGAAAANLPARFLLRGDLAGERPHVLFDPQWYRQTNPDLPIDAAPLHHYLTAGGWELRSPHPLFDPGFYLSQWAPGAVHGLTPLSHFLEVGGPAGISPHVLFDAVHYLSQRPEVGAAGTNPLLDYLASPAAVAVNPHPLFWNDYYLARYPDVTGINALEHFVRHGASEGRSPHPLFDVEYYWQQRPDVRSAGINALQHFLEAGAAEGADPHPLFSCRHYESQFQGAWDRRVNPLVHYLRWGRVDARNPHPGFDGRRYLDANPDVASASIDPLVHYVQDGGREGRARFRESTAAALLPPLNGLEWRVASAR